MPVWFDRLLGRGPVLDKALESQGPEFDINRALIDPAIIGLATWADAVVAPGYVYRYDAIQSPAVTRCRNLICGTIGQLPLNVFDANKQPIDNGLLKQPERNRPRMVTMTKTLEDILFEGRAYWLVTERYANGFPAFVHHISPDRVDDQSYPARVDGKEVADLDLIRFSSPNDPLLRAGARAIRTALQLEAAAYRAALSPMPQGLFQPDGEEQFENDDVKKFLADWRNARQQNADGYIPAGVKYQTLSWSPEQLQLIAARENADARIATLCGIDAEQVNVSTTSRTYFNSFDKRKEFLDFTLGPYMQAIEDRLSMGDVTPRGQYAKFNVDAFLETDTLTRYQTYAAGLQVGAITPDEIRALEDKPPIEGTSPVAASNPAALTQFSSDQDVLTFDAPPAAAEFRVDLEKRTIQGLAVPYGQTAQSGGRTWSFSKGSLAYDDVSRVKLLDGHDWSKPIGRAVSLEDTDAGLLATFKVAATPAGDEALLMASDLVKDGLSIGVGNGGTFDERDGVFHAVSAPLAHVALTPCPAFDSARVTAVAASKNNQGDTVTDTKVSTDAKTDEVVGPDFSGIAEQVAALLIKGKPAESGPQAVTPVAEFEVKEELPYRFDGTKGSYDFSSDLFAAARGDGEAQLRGEKFLADKEVQAAFDITKANTSPLNPVRPRPDLFVDNLDYITPVYTAMYSGTIADATPFVLPKYNTSSGLVADHTEGTEPTGGAYSVTSQTVTPAPLSGKADISREVMDQGGNPQISQIIWRQIMRDWAETLEAKAVALLAGLAPTTVTLTTGAVDDALAGELEAALADLQFVRGGDRFNKFPLHVDLYKALIAARDTTGRVLYPAIGPENANGSAAPGFGQIIVGGKAAVPAWGLGATSVNASKSYLFNSDDCHVWASAPQQLRFEYQVATITLGVWGYQATANTRLAGVRAFSYDPVV